MKPESDLEISKIPTRLVQLDREISSIKHELADLNYKLSWKYKERSSLISILHEYESHESPS